MSKIALKVVGFVLAFAVAAGIEFAIVSILEEVTRHRVLPRGPGWVVIPVLAGIAGARVLSNLRTEHVTRLLGNSQRQRYAVAAVGSWYAVVLAYVFVAEPFGYQISGDEWMTVLRWLLVPPVVALFIYMAFSWASRPRTEGGDSAVPRPEREPTLTPTPTPSQAPTPPQARSAVEQPAEERDSAYWRRELEKRFPAKKAPDAS